MEDTSHFDPALTDDEVAAAARRSIGSTPTASGFHLRPQRSHHHQRDRRATQIDGQQFLLNGDLPRRRPPHHWRDSPRRQEEIARQLQLSRQFTNDMAGMEEDDVEEKVGSRQWAVGSKCNAESRQWVVGSGR